MVQFTGLFLTVAVLSTSIYAAPFTLEGGIQQTLSDSTQKWEQACNAAGGGKNWCNALAVAALETLLADASDCGQLEDAVDSLVNLSKQLNSEEMITNLEELELYRSGLQPRSTHFVRAPPTPQADSHMGLSRLTLIRALATSEEARRKCRFSPLRLLPITNTGSGGSQLQNGKDAQALNKKFSTLTATSPCTDGEDACVNGGFAQCVGGKFAITSCGSLTCVALPLVNSPGISVTCDTEADALARIAASGATGGLTGA